MNIQQQIFRLFLTMVRRGTVPIEGMPEGYEAWVFRSDSEYGVLFKARQDTVISDSFANVFIRTGVYSSPLYPESNHIALYCSIDDPDFQESFSHLCYDFVYTGPDGSRRNNLINDPTKWWKRWKILVGNSQYNPRVYAVLAELISLHYLQTIGQNPVWEGPSAGVVDIRGDDFDVEVKSTDRRYSQEITLSGPFQLDSNRELHLYHCSFQKSEVGFCIDDAVKALEIAGADMVSIEEGLKKLGYGVGTVARRERYILLRMSDIPVTESFPKIVPESFRDGKLPDGIKRITYTVDISNLDYSPLDTPFL